MRSAVLMVPGSLATRTGGSIYDRRIAEGLRRLGWSMDVRELDGTFPRPSSSAVQQAARAFATTPTGTVTLVDGLVLGAIPEIVITESSRLPIVALVHLPLGADPGLDVETAARLAEAERRALGAVARVIVTGRATVPLLGGYGLPPSRVVVIEPGTDSARLSSGSDGSPLRLLCVATLNPGKGHEALLAALASAPTRDWHLTCAGSLTRHPPTVDRVQATMHRLGLDDRVTLAGELDAAALEECYHHSDVFVLATLRETYGMAVAEALAHGLPVVSTATGAIGDLVDEAAGLLVPPGDTQALGEALSRVLLDGDLRKRLAEGARRARLRLSDWEHASRKMAATLESIGHG